MNDWWINNKNNKIIKILKIKKIIKINNKYYTRKKGKAPIR